MGELSIRSFEFDRLAWPPDRQGAAVILVTVRGSDGMSGYGEAVAGPGRMALLRRLAGLAVGCDAFRLTALRARWTAGLAGAATSREIASLSGAVEAALLDLQARHAGVPLFRHLGGRHTDRIPLAGRIGPAEDPADLAADLIGRFGCRALTIEAVGDGGEDVERLLALRRAWGPDVGLRLDLLARPSLVWNQAVLAGVDEAFPEFVTDPADGLAGLARLRKQAGAAIAAGRVARDPESLGRAIAGEALDVWLADALECGGPVAFTDAMALCRTFAIDVALDARDRTEIGASLALHLAAVHRIANRAVELAPGLIRGAMVLAGGLRIEDGRCRVPEGIGLGVTPDPGRLAALRIEQVVVSQARCGIASAGASA